MSAQALQAPRRALTGHCGVGLIEDLTVAPLPQALADFVHVHPGATLELVSAPGPAMREAFTAGRLHLALCVARAPRATRSSTPSKRFYAGSRDRTAPRMPEDASVLVSQASS